MAGPCLLMASSRSMVLAICDIRRPNCSALIGTSEVGGLVEDEAAVIIAGAREVENGVWGPSLASEFWSIKWAALQTSVIW